MPLKRTIRENEDRFTATQLKKRVVALKRQGYTDFAVSNLLGIREADVKALAEKETKNGQR